LVFRVLVTGGSGFIGTNLIAHFVGIGVHVINFDVAPPRNPEHFPYWREIDLLDKEKLYEAVHDFNPSMIYHMAARTDLNGRSIHDYSANTVGVENIISAIEGLTTLYRIIFASSRLVCRIGYQPQGDQDYCPTTPYGESKVLGEKIVRNSVACMPCSWVIVRPTSIWGPWFDVPYKTFFLTIARGRYLHPGSTNILKSFGFVGNTIHELVRLMLAPVSDVAGKTLYLADYPPIDVAVMANSIQCALDLKPIKTVPVGVLRLVAWAGDFFKVLGWQSPPLTSFRFENLLTSMVHDLEPLRGVVGELPHSMDEGVRITVDWLRAQGEVS
jgi:nucleoside-diphosphate-sugar epimerase